MSVTNGKMLIVLGGVHAALAISPFAFGKEFQGFADKYFFKISEVLLEFLLLNGHSKKDINVNVCFNRRNSDVDRDEYFDQELYDKRFAVERTNAWLDGYRSLLNRFDTTNESWVGFNYPAFMVIALKNLKRRTRKKFKSLHYLHFDQKQKQ